MEPDGYKDWSYRFNLGKDHTNWQQLFPSEEELEALFEALRDALELSTEEELELLDELEAEVEASGNADAKCMLGELFGREI